MFGYVNVYKPEMKVKDFYRYKAYYCGLCRTLKSRYGYIGQMTLTYDMTFLIILLTSLYESTTKREQHRCVVHPLKQHDMLLNEITEYAADMNIVLTYYHFLDDWQDDKSIAGFAGAQALKRDFKKLMKKYPRQCEAIKNSLDRLKECEDRKEMNLDTVSGCFGELMAEIFVWKQDMWEETLRKTGFYLGKFIYLMDAYEDVEEDIKKSSYNPLTAIYKKETFTEDSKNMLTMMMAESASEFEKLPCLTDVDILRNIIYNGVWIKFKPVQNEKDKEEGNEHDHGSI